MSRDDCPVKKSKFMKQKESKRARSEREISTGNLLGSRDKVDKEKFDKLFLSMVKPMLEKSEYELVNGNNDSSHPRKRTEREDESDVRASKKPKLNDCDDDNNDDDDKYDDNGDNNDESSCGDDFHDSVLFDINNGSFGFTTPTDVENKLDSILEAVEKGFEQRNKLIQKLEQRFLAPLQKLKK